MKKSIKFITMMSLALTMTFFGCDKDDPDDIPAGDAKVELQEATQDITYNMALMMSTPQMESMMFLYQLTGIQIEKSSVQLAISEIASTKFLSMSDFVRDKIMLKDFNDEDPFEYGEFLYNFETDMFDLINPDVDYVLFSYPANQEAYVAQQNNASMMLSNIGYVEIELTDEWGTYTEIIPTSVDVEMMIDDQTVMTLGYNATVTSEGLPTTASLAMNMQPYTMDLTFSGSGVNYLANLFLRMNADVLLSFDLNLAYTSDMDYLENVSGNAIITPLKFDGSVDVIGMENCGEEDIDCMNNSMAVEVIQSEKNQKLGDLEFRMYYDAEWDEEYPDLAIVFEDGTYQFLSEFASLIDGLGKKRSTLARN